MYFANHDKWCIKYVYFADHGNKVTQLESQDVNLYDTLVDHTSKPVPKPRLSMGSSPEMEKKSPTACRSSQVSVQYAKIDKSKTENVLARFVWRKDASVFIRFSWFHWSPWWSIYSSFSLNCQLVWFGKYFTTKIENFFQTESNTNFC